jgi:hypothetical protein
MIKTRDSWRLHDLATQYPGLSASQIVQLFTLYFTEDTDLFVFWEVPSLKVEGFHHIGGMNLGLQHPLQLKARLGTKINEAVQRGEKTMLGGGRALFASTAREQKELLQSLMKPSRKDSSPIRVILDFEEELMHDFVTG